MISPPAPKNALIASREAPRPRPRQLGHAPAWRRRRRHQRAADERGRAARAGGALVRGDAGVGGDDRDLLERQAELLGEDLREHGAAALAELGGADGGRGGAVGVQADHRHRGRVRAGVGRRDREPDAAAGPAERLASAARGRRAGRRRSRACRAGSPRPGGRRSSAAAPARRSPAGRRPRPSAARPRGCPAARRSRAASEAGTVLVNAERTRTRTAGSRYGPKQRLASLAHTTGLLSV